MTDIRNDADDSPSAVLGDDLSEWVLPRPQSFRERLIHHYNGVARRSIAFRELSSGLQRDFQGVEISITHNANKCLGMLVLFVNLSFTRDLPRAVAAERQNIGYPGSRDARDGASAMQHIVDEGVLLRETGDAKTRVDPQGGGSLGLKSQIHVEHPNKTLNQQSGTNQ
jgi:hypothetical protein